MKLSDYVIEYISRYSKRVFVVVGGGAMHLNDSLCKMEYTCMMHEQGAALAAQAYGHVTNQLGVCMVTTGPGGTNAVTGCLAAWMDSTPVLFISGQVQTSQAMGTSGVRYKGAQEADIVSIVSPITKYAITVADASQIRCVLGAAIHAATTGRKGPVWVDIPLDIQSADIDPRELQAFTIPFNEWEEWQKTENIRLGVEATKKAIDGASKPVILAGHGIISSNATKSFYELLDRLKCPVLLTWKSIYLLSDKHPLYCGRPGTIGQRAANWIQQNSDFLLVLGAKMDYDQTAYQLAGVAPGARKIVVDIDPAELAKYDGWTKVNADVKDFIDALKIDGEYGTWLKECKQMNKDNPIIDR